ncbi:MAG TPA: hypothetical protein DCS31_01220 [Candidatus Competibacteraceae bacterium]|nr:hypothetical protein [Candidatus Competibacteraceae bacterium]HRC69813.1 hypothetical protein [Candidatus Competibacter denitrificans]
MDLLLELADLTKALDEAGLDYALCGGLALAVYARPRATLDIDLMVEPAAMDRIKKVVEPLGFAIAALPMRFHNGAVQIQRLTKIDPTSSEHLALDLLLVTPETQASWESRVAVEWEGGILKVLSPQGLIALKSLRNSGKDQDDIAYLSGLLHED